MSAPLRPMIPIGVQPGTKALRLERRPAVCAIERGWWSLWVHANHDFTQGTMYRMHDDGHMDRVTLHPDGTESVFDIKPSDKEEPL